MTAVEMIAAAETIVKTIAASRTQIKGSLAAAFFSLSVDKSKMIYWF